MKRSAELSIWGFLVGNAVLLWLLPAVLIAVLFFRRSRAKEVGLAIRDLYIAFADKGIDASVDESNDPVENGWVGDDGQP